MILYITPNPALDRTLIVPGYGAGGVFRPQQQFVMAAGKGVNAARAAITLGSAPAVAGFLAGLTGVQVAGLAEGSGLRARWTRLEAGETRTCIVLVDPEARQTTVVNEAGPATSADDWARLHADVLDVAREARAICLSGSLPPGSPLDSYRGLLKALLETGRPVWVDSSGAALKAALLPGVNVKISQDEAADLLGGYIESFEDAQTAAAAISRRTGGITAVTMGALGAVLSDKSGTWRVKVPKIDAISAVGSGDSFLAGLVTGISRGEALPDALTLAGAAGTANALSTGAGRFAREEIELMLAQTTVQRV